MKVLKRNSAYNIWKNANKYRMIENLNTMEITDKRIINLYYNLVIEHFPKKYEDVFKEDSVSITFKIEGDTKATIELLEGKYKISESIYENHKYVDSYYFFISIFQFVKAFKLKFKIKKIRAIINNHETDVFYKKMVGYLPKNFKRAEKLREIL